ncbi:MAG: glycosyltransferase family 2 protein [Promethearchaeota archaeon]
MLTGKKITVLIPTKNEAKAMKKLMSQLDAALSRYEQYEIIFIDKSNDDTKKIINALKDKHHSLIQQVKNGYGDAYKLGIKKAKGDYIVFIDGDLTYSPFSIPKFISLLVETKTDFINGIRHPEEGAMSLINKIGNIFLSTMINLLFLMNIKDSQCGLKAIKRNALKKLELKEDGMAFATEILIEAKMKKLRIAEVDINYRKRFGETKLNRIKDGIEVFLFIIKKFITSIKKRFRLQ